MPILSYTTKSDQNIFRELNTMAAGLTAEEALLRVKQYGYNEIASKDVRWWHIIWRQLNTPFIFLLLLAIVISFALGETVDGAMVALFVLINTVLGFVQEYHAERSLELLKKYLVTEVLVRRGGEEKRIPTRELVPGDILVVEAGDRMAGDIRFFESTNLIVDESALTGESTSVEKSITPLAKEASAYFEAHNIGFSGTIVVSGRGAGVVVTTGKNTVLGDISRLTIETNQSSSFEKNLHTFSKFILRMVVVILVVLFAVNLLIKGTGSIFELLIFSIALAVSVVPEALPVVTTVALSKGAAKLAKHHVVVKRLSAVEDLGSIEILCSDKTGTLTENSLSVHELHAMRPDDCLLFAALASEHLGKNKRDANNAFDRALWEKLPAAAHAHLKAYQRVDEIPFDPARRRSSVVVEKDGALLCVVRGAPETIFTLCVGLPKKEEAAALAWIAAEGKVGNRVIAVATKEVKNTADCFTSQDECKLSFVGLISFVDALKSSAAAAIKEAKRLGVAVKILTGDSKEVAGAVAAKVALIADSSQVLTGAEFEAMNEAERTRAVEQYAVFARVSPEQKYRIIELLEKKYEVGFLGEGINDAPALKMANVGIVVKDAADIARDAADVVLLQKSLAVIIDGIREGREIFANTIKYIKITLISNFGNFYALAVAAILIPYLPMLPVQILLLNLLSDFPMIAIATDTVDKAELKRPRSYNIKEVLLISVMLGVVSTLFDFIFFRVFYRFGAGTLRTCWFMGSVLTELALIYSMRTRGFFLRGRFPGLTLLTLSLVATATAIILPFTHFGAKWLGLQSPSPMKLGLVFGIVLTYFIVSELIKLLYYRSNKDKNRLPGHPPRTGGDRLTKKMSLV